MSFSQEGRLLGFTSPLGKDVLLIGSIHGIERISAPFRFEVDLYSTSDSVSFADILGKEVCVTLRGDHGSERFIHGIVCRFGQGRTYGELSAYRAQIVPYLWLLTRRTDCRIFQNMTVPDIVEKVLKDNGVKDLTNKLTASYDKLVYCVQYRETAFDFVSRLMEEYGIFYYFEHLESKHTMVLCDAKTVHQPLPGGGRLSYQSARGGVAGTDQVTALSIEEEIRSEKYAHVDYNFEMPNTNLLVSVGGASSLELYDYPGRFENRNQGDQLAKIRLEEESAQARKISGEGTCRRMAAGYKYELEGHYRQDANRSYTLVEVIHHGVQGGYRSGDAHESDYHNSYICIPDDVVYRPERTTRRPFISGSQTAVVVGKAGEEHWVDKYGRVKVQFCWDRQGARDEGSSCWVRVSQNWAGKGWGAMFLPRIGQEVIVDFVDGDPDRPIITGRVYNADQSVPYSLPGDQTQSTIKTRSTKSGTPDNFNEIRFQDAKGKEELYIHAEKDCNIVVEHDRTEDVGHDRSLSVGHDKSESVKNDKSVSVGKDHSETIDNNMSLSVGKDRSMNVGANLDESVGKNQSTSIGKDFSIQIGDNETVSIGKNADRKVGQNETVTVTKAYGLKAKKILLQGDDEVTIKSGSASISLKKNGDVTIKGNKITIKGSGNVVIKGSKVTEN